MGKKVEQKLDCKRIVKARFRVSSIVSSVLGFRSDCTDYLSGTEPLLLRHRNACGNGNFERCRMMTSKF